MRPRERHVRWTIVAIVCPAAQHREVRGRFPPREAVVCRRRRIEDAKRAGLGVEQLDAVPGLVLGRDRNGQQAAFVLPREFGDVAEGGVAAGGQMTHDQRRARGAIGFRRRRIAAWFLVRLRRISPHRKVRAARVEGE